MITVESEVSRISTIEFIVKEIEAFQAELQRLAFEKDELEFQLPKSRVGLNFKSSGY
jgi:hypothetical protein